MNVPNTNAIHISYIFDVDKEILSKFRHVQVPVTNFFGSIMKTIHTDSAYTALIASPEIEGTIVLEDTDSERRALQSDVDMDTISSQDMKASL